MSKPTPSGPARLCFSATVRALSCDDDAVRVANFFGMTLAEFLDDATASDRAEVVRLWLQLSPQERALLQAAIWPSVPVP